MAQTNESQEQVTVNVETLQPVTRTLMTIGALPTSYLISMTYEEQLLWLQNYLIKTVIPAINNNAEATKEVQDIVMALQDYINDYFNNLDVQEEINNKLDQMVEDGTLDNILNNYIQLFKVYNTHADMIADSSNFVNGMKVKTLGYYSVNDGGSAEYVVTNIENSNIFQESIGNNLYINLLYQDTIYSKQVGLKGDGISDESVALNNFFVKNINANKVLNKGTYLATLPIIIQGKWTEDSQTNPDNSRQTIKFDLANILYLGQENGDIIVINNFSNARFENISINKNSNKGFVNIIGCRYIDFNNFDINKLALRNNINDYQFDITSIEHINFNNGRLIGGIKIDGTDSFTNAIFFNNCFISGTNNENCVEIISPNSNQDIVFNQCDLSYATNSVFKIDEVQTGGGNITTINCYFDSAIPIFENDETNKIIYNDYSSHNASGSTLAINPLKYNDIMKGFILPSISSNGAKLPCDFVNLVYNGNIERGSNISTRPDRLFGTSDEKCTKEYITSDINKYSNALKLTFNMDSTESKPLYFDSLPAPKDSSYYCAIRLKKIQGSGTIQLSWNGSYYNYTDDMLPVGEEVVLTTRMSFLRELTKDSQTRGYLSFSHATDLVVEIYEVIVSYGKLILFDLPLHENSKRNYQLKIDENGNLCYRKYNPQAYSNDTGWDSWKIISSS